MPRVQGDNLELSNLKAATGNSATSNYSIATAAGTTTGPIAFSDFTIDAVGSTISSFVLHALIAVIKKANKPKILILFFMIIFS